MELGRRDSVSIRRRGIHPWSSVGGIAALSGAEDGAEESGLGARPTGLQYYLAQRIAQRNPAGNSAGRIAVLFGAEDEEGKESRAAAGGEERRRRRRRRRHTSLKKSKNLNIGG